MNRHQKAVFISEILSKFTPMSQLVVATQLSFKSFSALMIVFTQCAQGQVLKKT